MGFNMVDNPRTGSTLESMLRKDDIFEEVEEKAIKAVSACSIDDLKTWQKQSAPKS